jgi:hypothetical protein
MGHPELLKVRQTAPAPPQGDYYTFFDGDEEKNWQFFSSSPSKNV